MPWSMSTYTRAYIREKIKLHKMKKATLDFCIYKIWQILKPFAESSSINCLFLKSELLFSTQSRQTWLEVLIFYVKKKSYSAHFFCIFSLMQKCWKNTTFLIKFSWKKIVIFLSSTLPLFHEKTIRLYRDFWRINIISFLQFKIRKLQLLKNHSFETLRGKQVHWIFQNIF